MDKKPKQLVEKPNKRGKPESTDAVSQFFSLILF